MKWFLRNIHMKKSMEVEMITRNYLRGLFYAFSIGSLIGAIVGIFLAPHSGEETRDRFQRGSQELKNRAKAIIDGTKALANKLGIKTSRQVKVGKTEAELKVTISIPQE